MPKPARVKDPPAEPKLVWEIVKLVVQAGFTILLFGLGLWGLGYYLGH